MAWIQVTCMTVVECFVQVEPSLHGKEFIPTRWPFELEKTLARPELVRKLLTKMYEYHEWYMKASANGDTMFPLLVKLIDYFGHGEQLLWLEYEDVYQVHHQDALDVCLVSAWTL